jgi:NTP pyrophosphatase (non-canonical NTP hydrolase)
MAKDFLDQLMDAVEFRLSEQPNIDGSVWPIEKWLNKLTEENGELAQCFNKDKTYEEKEEELCDCIIVLCAIAHKMGVKDLKSALRNKFNKTSKKKGSKSFIA